MPASSGMPMAEVVVEVRGGGQEEEVRVIDRLVIQRVAIDPVTF